MKVILFFIILILNLYCYPQKNSNTQRKYTLALKEIKSGSLQIAKQYLEEIILYEPDFADAYFLLGEVFTSLEQYDSVLYYYRIAAKNCGKKNPEFYLYLGNFEFYNGNIKEALYAYKMFQYLVPNSKYNSLVKEQIQRCEFSQELMKNPVPFNPVNIGESINSIYDEYYPYISPDDSMIIFTRKVPLYYSANPSSDDTQEDFYVSYLTKDGWTKAIPLSGEINTRYNEGAQTVTADGKYMVFTACNRPDGKGSCDLYYSEYINGKWTRAVNIQEINTSAWESQPSLSADGRMLFFASERLHGIGNSDIYVSYRLPNGKWSKPVLLDTTINTKMAETSPFIHPDGKTLYFCSNGHWGVGGFDIFVSRLDDNGKWTKPVNLGYPINTPKNEIGLIVSASGKRAYITSSREGGFGLNDIYFFDLPENVQAKNVIFIKGIITDEFSGKPLQANCEIIDLNTGKTVYITTSDSTNGKFLIGMPAGNSYALHITKQGYLLYAENLQINENYNELVKNISLKKIKTGEKIVLPNIFFDTDSFSIKPVSFPELDKLVSFLEENKKIKIEIGGHTDNTGSVAYNKLLSEKRAKAVYDYLLSKNIEPSRMTYKGYGSSSPLGSNETEKGKALNRRTEIKILP
jgi:outer membrane protein OmpA-like peptidoglycan-associated protein/tetratricopeptide (TPR) repeat protein